MGKVNVVLPSGEVVTVDKETADASRFERSSGEYEAQQATAAVNEERSSGFVEGTIAAGEGALDAVSGGIYGQGRALFDPEGARNMRIRAEERSGMRLLGEAGALLAPTGYLGQAAKTVGGMTAVGASMRAGEAVTAALGKTARWAETGVMSTGARRAGQVAEGVLLGAQAHVAQANVTGDPLSIEGVVIDAGLGGALNYGAAVISDKILAKTAWAKGAVAETDDLVAAQKSIDDFEAKMVDGDHPAYQTFHTTYTGVQRAAKQANAKVAAQVEEYAQWTSPATAPAKITKAARDIEKARNQVLSEIERTPYGREAARAQRANAAAHEAHELAAREAETQFKRTANQYEQFVSNPEKFSKTLDKFDEAIDELAAGPKNMSPAEQVGNEVLDALDGIAAYRQRWGGAPITEGVGTDDKMLQEVLSKYNTPKGMKQLQDAVDAGYVKLGPNNTVLPGTRPSTSPLAPEDLKRLKGTVSKARQLKTGGYKANPNRWTKEAGAPSDVDGAMRELHEVQKELMSRSSRHTGPKLPKIPERPVLPDPPPPFELPPPTGDVTDARYFSEVARDLSNGTQDAFAAMQRGEYESALVKLKAVRDRAASHMPELVLPELPMAPGKLRPVGVEDLPKSLKSFHNMTPQKAAELAKSVDELYQLGEKAPAEAFGKLMDDLTIPRGGSIAADVAGVQQSMKRMALAQARLEREATEGTRGIFGTIKQMVRRGGVRAAGRSADQAAGGGIPGSFAREGGSMIGNAILGYTMGGMDNPVDAAVGAVLLGGKTNLRGRIANLLAKHGEKVGRTVGKLAPVTTYLGSSLIGGDSDSGDIREQAVRRANEVYQEAVSTPDKMFVALEPLLGQGELALQMHQKYQQATQYLAQTAPKDPGIDVTMTGSKWQPSFTQAIEFAHRIEAVYSPMSAIERAMKGHGHQAATEALWHVYPALMSELAVEVMSHPERLQKLTYEQQRVYSDLFRVPLIGLQQPAVIATLQGNYLQAPSQPTPGGGSPGGRPPAVRSQVAGSNVSALIGQ